MDGRSGQSAYVLNCDYANQPLNRASLQKALRTLRSQRLTGAALVAALTELYHLHGLDMLRDRSASQSLAEDDDVPRVVCSEALIV